MGDECLWIYTSALLCHFLVKLIEELNHYSCKLKNLRTYELMTKVGINHNNQYLNVKFFLHDVKGTVAFIYFSNLRLFQESLL